MPRFSRRSFLRHTLAAVAATAGPVALPTEPARLEPNPPPDDRLRGLLLGAALGDALGGPIEFQPAEAKQRLPNPPKVWRDGEILDDAARTAAAGRLELRSYRELRPQPESYGQWNAGAVAGTVTDDTRHKLILLHALRRAETEGRWPLGVRDLAQAHLDWPRTAAIARRPEYAALAADWLEEWQFAARWILGERDLARARPPERMWQGLPTCCGQMTLPPLAAVFAGEPERAYRAAWHLAFFDNGFGRDLNAALIAGLAVALVTPVDPKAPATAWNTILTAMRRTDPFGYARIRWTQRAVDRWLDLALDTAKNAAGRPARLFAALEAEFRQTTKWEAQVPLVVAFACLALAGFEPLPALQLSMEWGHDTDSYAALTGAFIGALHGADLFPPAWRTAVTRRLEADFQADLEADAALLARLRGRARREELVGER